MTSIFKGSIILASLLGSVGGGSTPTPAAPFCYIPPAISGSGILNAPLTRVEGVWGGYPSPSITWVWKADGTVVQTGGDTYTPTGTDLGKTITISESGANSTGGPIVSTSTGKTISGGAAADPSATVYDTTMGVAVDADGFTSLPLRSGATRYFVGNGGNDANDGLTHATRLATPTAGRNKLVSGRGDQLLLAEGSTFTDAVPQLQGKDGFSAAYPTVVSSYDPADPTNTAKYGRGDQRNARPVIIPTNGMITSSLTSYIALVGLDINPGNTELNQVSFIGGGAVGGAASYVLVENNIFRYTGIGYVDGGNPDYDAPLGQHLIIRNNSIYGVWSATDAHHVGGIYVDGNGNVAVEDNVIYHTGWKIGVSRDVGPDAGGPTVFNHPLYLQCNCGTQVVRRNLMVDNSADGGIARGDFLTWKENVAIKSPNGFGIGSGNPQDFGYSVKGSLVDVSYNLSVGAVDMNTGNQRGQGYSTANLTAGSKIHNNLLIYSDATPAAADQTIATTGGSGYGFPSRPTYTNFENNVAFHWSSPSSVITEFGSPVYTSYQNNLWDAATNGSNVQSTAGAFPHPYTQAELYAALTATYPSITDYTSFVNYVIAHPEAHVQRTLRSLAFAGYGIAAEGAPTLNALTPSSTSHTRGAAASGGTLGLTFGSTITGSGLPSGLTIDSYGRWTWDGSGSGATSGTFTLIETLAGATNSPRSTTVSYDISAPVTFQTLNPSDKSGANIVLSNGNLTVKNDAASWDAVRATSPLGSGKYYWEVTTDINADGNAAGIADSAANLALTSYWGRTGYSHAAVNDVGIATLRYNGTTQTGSSGATHSPIRFAYDGTADKLWIGDSTGWLNGDPAAGTGGLSLSGMSSGRYIVWQGENGDRAPLTVPGHPQGVLPEVPLVRLEVRVGPPRADPRPARHCPVSRRRPPPTLHSGVPWGGQDLHLRRLRCVAPMEGTRSQGRHRVGQREPRDGDRRVHQADHRARSWRGPLGYPEVCAPEAARQCARLRRRTGQAGQVPERQGHVHRRAAHRLPR
jgi:hypothetical protein